MQDNRDDTDLLQNSAAGAYDESKVKTLAVFPSIFKGEHICHKEMVEVTVGKEIEVIFDQPTSLQIDGETVLNVSSYCVHSYAACTGVSKNEKQTFAKV